MASNKDDMTVTLIFSKEQLLKDIEIYNKLGEPYVRKYLLKNGKPKQFTSIISDKDNVVYQDSKIIAENVRYGDLNIITK